jgi:hypothetical protein
MKRSGHNPINISCDNHCLYHEYVDIRQCCFSWNCRDLQWVHQSRILWEHIYTKRSDFMVTTCKTPRISSVRCTETCTCLFCIWPYALQQIGISYTIFSFRNFTIAMHLYNSVIERCMVHRNSVVMQLCIEITVNTTGIGVIYNINYLFWVALVPIRWYISNGNPEYWVTTVLDGGTR